MFADLKAIVDLIRSGFAGFHELKGRRERKDIVLELLRTYFLLKGCADDYTLEALATIREKAPLRPAPLRLQWDRGRWLSQGAARTAEPSSPRVAW